MTYSHFYKALTLPAMSIIQYAGEYKTEEISLTLNLMNACEGNILLSGVGKSGDIARKISATLTSVGMRSFFISPLDALHGSLGAIHDTDVVFLISKSGETKELLEMVSLLTKSCAAKIILLTCGNNSSLERYAHCTIHYQGEECCGANFIPTTTTTMALVIGDALAVTLMKMRNFTLEQFSMNHPGGTLGQRVRDSLGRAQL